MLRDKAQPAPAARCQGDRAESEWERELSSRDCQISGHLRRRTPSLGIFVTHVALHASPRDEQVGIRIISISRHSFADVLQSMRSFSEVDDCLYHTSAVGLVKLQHWFRAAYRMTELAKWRTANCLLWLVGVVLLSGLCFSFSSFALARLPRSAAEAAPAP